MKKKSPVSLRENTCGWRFRILWNRATTYTLDLPTRSWIITRKPARFLSVRVFHGAATDSMELGDRLLICKRSCPCWVLPWCSTRMRGFRGVDRLPSYVAKTDSAGMFRVTNIKNDTYQWQWHRWWEKLFVCAFRDKVGFIDSLIQTISFPTTVYDTIHPDTTVCRGRRTKKEWSSKCLKTRLSGVISPCSDHKLFIPMFDEEKTHCIWLMKS